jgi:hypothetical protein
MHLQLSKHRYVVWIRPASQKRQFLVTPLDTRPSKELPRMLCSAVFTDKLPLLLSKYQDSCTMMLKQIFPSSDERLHILNNVRLLCPINQFDRFAGHMLPCLRQLYLSKKQLSSSTTMRRICQVH